MQFLTTADPDPAANARAITTFLTQHDGRPITPALVVTLATFVRSVNGKNVERNTRIALLEKEIADLKTKASVGVQSASGRTPRPTVKAVW